MKKQTTFKLQPTKLFAVLLAVLTTFTFINSVNATERNPIKNNIETFSVGFKGFIKANVPFKINRFDSTPATGGGFNNKDTRDLGKKGFIYPYDEKINNANGDFVYEDYNFEDFALQNNADPNGNTQFTVGQLEKNLMVSKEEGEDGVTSWTIIFYPKGRIYNKPSDLSRHHSLDNAVAGVAFTKDVEIIKNEIIVETYETTNNQKIGEITITPGGYNGLDQQISDAKKAEFTTNQERTAKLFFGGYSNEYKDPITLRAGNLKTIASNGYAQLFDKSFVFETRNTEHKKWVVKFKTVENYSKRETLNVFTNTKQDIQRNRSHYLSGVMAGIGSWQNGRTVSGVNFMGKNLSDKFIYTETIDVNETFLTNKNTITVPPRTITFHKEISRYQFIDKAIDYSVSINESFEMPSGQPLSGNIKKITTKYTVVDYEKYDPNTPVYGRYVTKHSITKELEAITESITPISGYTTKSKKEAIRSDVLAINVTHRANDYSSPEDEIKIGLDDLTKQLTAFINDYPVGVGHVTVEKSPDENLDDVPTKQDLAKLKEKQDEIKAKINEIKDFIEKKSNVLRNKKAEYEKLVNAYEKVFNGFNNQSVKEFTPNYEDIKNNLSTDVNSPEYNKKYSDIIKELNEAAMDKLKKNTSYDNMRAYITKAVMVKKSDRYNQASDKRKKAFDEAFQKVRTIFTKSFKAGEQYGNATLAEVLEAKRALNEVIINLDRPDAPPVLTAPREGDTSVTSTIPPNSKEGDIIKIYRFENGNYIEFGSYTLKEADLNKASVEVPLNKGVTLTEGETLIGKIFRDYLGSEESSPVVVEEVLICTQTPANGAALNTKVGISTFNRGNDNWNLNGLGAYLALESNTKGFIITRNADPEHTIENPVEGMLVFDTTAKCLKLYSSKTGTAQWNCIKQGCNHK